ncbi:MAG: 4'-phosphopantetheinyl transferase superfamily protein [Nitrospiraceae bacterium]|nr:4'-phosphopantetheinyl transferase superfamily protein [Nitrospiraceae bacterium]
MTINRSEGLPVLRPGQLYLWTLRTDELTDTAIACGFQAILSADERNKARRFRRATDRQQFVISHALVRLALSNHFPVPAGDWRFDRDHNGRPFIVAPVILPPVRFSLSHTQGLVACLITLSAEAAVDVEKIEHNQDLALVARQVLSPAEQRALSVLSGKDWTARFFDYWTLKEAYAKARGLGLSLTLSHIGFECGRDDTLLARFASQVDDNSSAWVFWRRHLSPQHTISVAAKKDFGDGIILRPVKFDGVELTPFRGHFIFWEGGVQDVETKNCISAGFPATDGRVVPVGPQPGRAVAGV